MGESGIFQGSVSFEGEREYTRVAARRAKGTVIRRYRRVCKRPFDPPLNGDELREETVLYSAQARAFGVLRFMFGVDVSLALGDEVFAASLAFGGERRRVGPVAVSKVLTAFEESASIKTSSPGERPITAEVKPQRPFEGTASFLQEGKAPATWTGDLRARLPGSGLVPLAGPEFQAEICRASNEAGRERCFESVLNDSALAQGSGSHSQPLALARLSSLR